MIRHWITDWWTAHVAEFVGELLVLACALLCSVILFALFGRKSR